MYRTLLADARFHRLLLAFDRDIAAIVRASGCVRCRGRLHAAAFLRKPRGLPVGLDENQNLRLSFCCSKRQCRKRNTPPSMRFLGRKVYIGAFVVVVTAMQQGGRAARQLAALYGVSRRTIARWRTWWRDVFAASTCWRVATAAFVPPVKTVRMPASLLERFAGDAEAKLIALLRLLLPITGGAGMRAA
jgi:hypothetical protein